MRSKALIALALIVLLPVAALGWLGLRVLGSEQQTLQNRVQALINTQLNSVDETLASYFAARQSELLADAQRLAVETDALRQYVQRAGRVRQVFVMDAKGERVHPPRVAPLSEAEQRFLQRSAEIWRNRDILYQGGGSTGAESPLTPSLGSAREPANRAQSVPAHGWYVWHWGAETDLIFWTRDASSRLIGFELEPARVMADLIGLLPVSDDVKDRLGDARMRLSDDRGRIVYQWGAWHDVKQTEAAKPLAVRPLGHPLGSWKLAYYAAPLAQKSGAGWFIMASILGALAFALGGLALYLYREHTREIRNAQQRVNFVNQVSHELKTPLTNIRMYAELLADQLGEHDDDSKPRRYLGVIVAESQRLSRLILNVLNFARLQRERLQLHRQPGRVDDVVSATLNSFRPALQAKGIAIDFRPNAPQTVSLDADALEQILNNLLSNVEKYAAAGGRLEVATSHAGTHSQVTVRDYGPGIPARERERIFAPFYRLSDRLSDGVTGTGIGLTIARELARLHGGELRLIEGDNGAAGACFQLSLRTAEGGQP